ncbi:ABC transporter permease [Terracidiphilus gabretensis]|jgi:putative ABC transport system permease protein|uniref:ABC transporter permease n=1 Tax=Terracidiphilus gabretensis TaxID=1577687 RepID=UPI0009EA788A|nr:ABC transporter permease [Terracidiphilus gabretensis]
MGPVSEISESTDTEQTAKQIAQPAINRRFQQTLLSARRTMVWSEILKIALDSFRASKLRLALTALGMVIGTASVILVVTIGMTGKEFILNEIQKIGTNEVELEYAGGGAAGSENAVYNDYLTRDDEKRVVAQVPGVMYSSPILEMHDRISFGGGVVKDTLVLGVSPDYQFIRNLLVPYGRFLDNMDDAQHMKCAVVTETFAKLRYGSVDAAVGREFSISGIPFTIIGVFKESVTDFGQSEIADETILIPYSVARYFTGTENVKQIYFSMRSMAEVQDATREITRIVSAHHRPNSVYKTQDLREVLKMADTISNILTAVLVLVSAVTLAVGGVGIMNIMLATVRARIREIGIRKALGATSREIRLQFLAEATIISLAGGIVGCFVGLSLPVSVRILTDFQLPVSPWSVVIALGAATLVGIVFGTMPATRAAQLDPVESLKYE